VKLERLELFGFKSFADRVTIEFNPGMTAIVGPNGCGKSNISDAIRWALGEQRPTLVRGHKMEEVIFNGTRDRKPINLAEVTLRFSNEDGLLPVDYAEVQISRRVFREGESEYRLNKQLCRLKDIQDLFLGTGVGTHSYSLIQQGMVDSILSERAEERRTLFEEAAGITRYKNRRRATERKLEATTGDLLRVEDIVSEVEKTVRSLRRQVGRTERFLAYRAEEARLDLHAAAIELAALSEREAPLAEALTRLADEEARLAAGLGEREAELERLELDLVEEREQERAARERADGLRRRIGRREEGRIVTAETLRHHAGRLESLDDEDERADRRAAELVERRETLEADRGEARSRLERIEERLRPEGGGPDDEESRVGELEAERESAAEEVEKLRERLVEARQVAARHASLEEGAAEQEAALSGELATLREEVSAAEQEADRAREALAASESERDGAASRLGRLREVEREAADGLERARERLAEERAAEQVVAGRLETLVAMEERLEGYGRAARSLLTEDRLDGVVGALPQLVEPSEPRFEAPLERFLESLGHALLVHDRTRARAVVDRLAGEDGGRVDLLVPDLVSFTETPPELPDPAAGVVIARGGEMLRWTGDSSHWARLRPLFDRLLVVSDGAAAVRCREALDERPGLAGQYVVAALDGTLIEPTGRWRTAGSDSEDGLLARRRRRDEAERELAARRETLGALKTEVDEAAAALADAKRRTEAAGDVVAEAEGAHAEARESLAVAEETATQARRRVASIEPRRLDLQAGRERAAAAVAEAEERIADLEADLKRARERADGLGRTLARLKEVRAERVTERHSIELERTEAAAALRAVMREIEHVESALRAVDAGREERARERDRIRNETVRLEEEREASAAEIEALHGELHEVDDRVRSSVERVRTAEERRAAIENELRERRRRHDEVVEARHEKTLARRDIEHRRTSIFEHLEEVYEGELETLLEDHPLEEEERDIPLETLRERLEEVRRKRANLGPVNMLAVEEHEKESERLEFLVGQRDDLVEARGQLEQAIRTINATARELFNETFAEIQARFTETFRTLFEGGHAELRLEDPDDPLESAIEIVASPRGKRVQSIGLLSGGERALTALALLFAIYQVKPSPFCILDEVDAPLDDANVSRFLKMIRHFSDRTQFVIITHNKRTMAEADHLYGITMEEPGVSTLVSVSLDGARDLAGAGAVGGGNGHASPNGGDHGDIDHGNGAAAIGEEVPAATGVGVSS